MNFMLLLLMFLSVLINFICVTTIIKLRKVRDKHLSEISKYKSLYELEEYQSRLLRSTSTSQELKPLRISYETNLPSTQVVNLDEEVLLKLESSKLSSQIGDAVIQTICAGDVRNLLKHTDIPYDPYTVKYFADIELYYKPISDSSK